jgi:hypothetical protein
MPKMELNDEFNLRNRKSTNIFSLTTCSKWTISIRTSLLHLQTFDAWGLFLQGKVTCLVWTIHIGDGGGGGTNSLCQTMRHLPQPLVILQ